MEKKKLNRSVGRRPPPAPPAPPPPCPHCGHVGRVEERHRRKPLIRYHCLKCKGAWGDEFPICKHPSFSIERIHVRGVGDYKTGDETCDECGESFSSNQVAEIERDREQKQDGQPGEEKP